MASVNNLGAIGFTKLGGHTTLLCLAGGVGDGGYGRCAGWASDDRTGIGDGIAV